MNPHALSPFTKALPWLMYALSVVIVVAAVQRLRVPAPRIVPAMSATQSDKFQVDQSPEARLLGVETTGGLTPPSVVLNGVFANSKGLGAAVLSIEGQPAVSVAVGEEVANGWKLVQVDPAFAVIERSGQRSKIALPEQQTDPNQFRIIKQNP
ncbi:type II secretion system protein N [Limnobacter sp.]|nr:type II secretion system protein N [Limnobacter sp.]